MILAFTILANATIAITNYIPYITEMTEPNHFAIKAALEGNIGGMLSIVTTRLKAEMKSRFEAYDLNVNEYYVFSSILEEEGLSQSELGRRLALPAYATSRLIDGMAAKGYLERRENPTSRRAHRIYPTRKAKKIAPILIRSVSEINDWVLKGLSETEKAAFLKTFSKIL